MHPQVQPGLYYLGATTLRGRFSGEQMIAVADIADRFGSGEVRCTNRQNLIVLDVPDAQVEEAEASLADIGLPTRGLDVSARDHLVHRACSSASSRSSRRRTAPRELIEHLERRVGDMAGSLRINLNGCPNACAQYQVADIGLQGGIARLADGGRVQGFILHIGGRLGADAGFGRRVSSKAIPADDAKYAVERIVRAYAAERPADGTFADWARQQSDRAAGGACGRRRWRGSASRPRRPPSRGCGRRPPGRGRHPSAGCRPATHERGQARALLVPAALPQFRLQLARPRATDEIGMPRLGLELGLAEAGEFLMAGRVGEHAHQTAGRAQIFHRFALAARGAVRVP